MKKFILYITLLMMPVLCSAKKAFVIEKDRTFIVTGEQPSRQYLQRMNCNISSNNLWIFICL